MSVGIWLAAALILALIEIASVDFVFLMLALGALAAAIAAFFGGGIIIQVLVFAVVSVLALILLRPFLKSIIHRSTPNVRMNVDAMIGERGVVTAVPVGDRGRVKFDDGIWSARMAPNVPPAPEGTEVAVVAIDGATVIVVPAIMMQMQPPATA